ncbi:MAG: dihydroneopterin aldolase [Flavobacteriaceae bacterium]|jgi:dihydroneopterin aldolase|nr:dihydroneopterin aldolase [Flavobacteriaceae bacterium]
MEKIKLKNIEIYAFHGCMEEEAKIGGRYVVNLTVTLNLKKAGKSDDLQDTVNYAVLTQIVVKQMKIRSHLLEHAAQRILDKIGAECKKIVKAEISVAKIAPPVNANVEAAKVIFKKKFKRK